MGILNIFNLIDINKKFNVDFFIETGTAMGHGLKFATECGYKKLYSIEYSKTLYEQCVQQFK